MSRIRRFVARFGLDILILGAATQCVIGTTLRSDADRPTGARLWFEAAAIAAVVLVLCARRAFPFAAPTATWVGAAALTFVDGQLITTQPGVLLAGLGAALLLGSLRGGTPSRIGLLIVLGCAALVAHNDPTKGPTDLFFVPMLFVIGWLVGYALRERSEKTEVAEERAARAEHDREAAARLAVAEERARMARELHDVVAHAVSVMVLQVGAVRHRMPASAAADREALGNVEQAGRTALAEMRALLGALREDGDRLELTPHPALDDLERLATDVRAAGLDVQLRVEGEPVDVPRALQLSAYRIVQEGLTNALRYAAGSRVDVTVDYAGSDLRIEVRDDGRGRGTPDLGTGHGLVGVGERVKIHGGDMSTFITTSGGFVLRVCLPLREGVG